MCKLKNIFLVVLAGCFLPVFADVYGTQQLIPAGNWVYDALFVLNNEQKRTSFATTAPLTVAELKTYFDLIDYEKLSPSGKQIHQKLTDYFNSRKLSFDVGPCVAAFNIRLNPNVSYKSNSDLDWTFATSYTGKVNMGGNFQNFSLDNTVAKKTDGITAATTDGKVTAADGSNASVIKNRITESNYYGAANSYQFSDGAKPFLEIPIYLGWGDLFFIETTPMFAKNYWALSADDNYVNIPLSSDDFEFLWPETAYGSVGKNYGKWGFNFNVARQGLQIGKTQTGSIIYNSTFQTNFYAQLNVYCSRFKYNMDIVEISKNKYMYLHQIEARPYFNWLRCSVTEGMLIQEPFELRFLNPIMIMHSFGAWDEYKTPLEDYYYDGEAHVCAYMGIQVEITPVKNLRIYGLYSQNEIQSEAEQSNAGGKAMPDSLGMQLGFEYTKPVNTGWWTYGLEGIYTTPYLYVKQGADWSLYSERYDMLSNGNTPICSWIGTPFGPDACGAQAKVGYKKLDKYEWNFQWLFLAHGSNSFGMFNNVVEIDGNTYSAYYPSVLRKLGFISDETSARIARDYKLSGTVSFTNQASLSGNYTINGHILVNGQIVYTMVVNNKNVEGSFAQGVQVIAGARCNLF